MFNFIVSEKVILSEKFKYIKIWLVTLIVINVYLIFLCFMHYALYKSLCFGLKSGT